MIRRRLPALFVVTVLVGVGLRVLLYVANRSFTLDESFIALNVQRRSASRLLGTLDWNSGAPPLFLELEKLLTAVLGDSEAAFRSLGLLAAGLSVLAFAHLARSILPLWPAAASLLLFSIAAPTVAYAAIAKPYSLDVLFVILVSDATVHVLQTRTRRSYALLCVLGIAGPLLAYASVFAVAASATALLLELLERRGRAASLRTGLVVAVWGLGLATVYLTHGETLSHLRRSLGPSTAGIGAVRSEIGAIRLVFGVASSGGSAGDALAAIASLSAAALAACGVVSLFKRSRPLVALLVLPSLYVLAAAAAGWYPLFVRTLLFVTPAAALLVGAGGAAVASSRRSLGAAAVAAVAVVATAQIVSLADTANSAIRDEGMQRALAFMASDVRPADGLYVGYASQYPLAYYLTCGCSDRAPLRALRAQLAPLSSTEGTPFQWAPALESRSPRVVVGRFGGYTLGAYRRDLSRVRQTGRVWILFSFLHAGERRALLRYLDSRAQRLRTHDPSGGVDVVGAALYRFAAR